MVSAVAITKANLASLTVVLGIACLIILPSSSDELREGFISPIIALEFASSKEDLKFLIGNTPSKIEARQRIKYGHYIDMFFLFAYSLLIASSILSIAAKTKTWVSAGIIFAILIIPLDIAENIILLAITETIENQYSPEIWLNDLRILTNLKWGTIALSLSLLGFAFIDTKRLVLGMSCILSSIFILVGLGHTHYPIILEIMAGLTALTLLLIALEGLIPRRLPEK